MVRIDDVQGELEVKDTRGRTPLMLAVTLGHLETARLLMERGGNINTENKEGWTGEWQSCLKVKTRKGSRNYPPRVLGGRGGTRKGKNHVKTDVSTSGNLI